MARPLRLEYEGAVYHVTSRGNAREVIYSGDGDRTKFLEILSGVVERYGFIIHAYCLMSNHYHLLVETPEGNLSRGMRQLNGVYTQWFNWSHKRVGHVLQGRYKAILVDKDEYLMELSRYLVLNPVRAGVVSRPEEWRWSSYRCMIGLDREPEYLCTEWLLSEFSGDTKRARDRYKSFVEDGIGKKESPLKGAYGGWILGGKRFLKEVGVRLEKSNMKKKKETPRRERHAARPMLKEIFAERDRREGMYEAVYQWGYKLQEVGDYVGLHYSRVSRIAGQVAKRKT